MTRVLFVTWDGPNSFYLQSLFLPIFKLMAQRNVFFHVLQFTWADHEERLALKTICEEQGCTYHSVSICRKPLALGSILTTFLGVWHIRRVMRKLGINIVVPRSTLPAMASILALRSYPDVGLIFDADGLPHDERVEFGGMSPYGIAYRLLRDFEALAIRRSDAVLTRSGKAIEILAARCGAGLNPAKFRVVTNGRNENLFKPATREERLQVRQSLGVDFDAPLIVYVGSSLKGKYCGYEIFEFFQSVHDQRGDAHLLLLTSSTEEANVLLNQFEELRSVCHIMHLPPENVARYIGASDLGLVLIHQTFSMQAVSAIKLGEYLLCGVPIVTSSGIGDSEDLIVEGVGYTLPNMSSTELRAAAKWYLNIVLSDRDGFRQRARDCGLRHCSLQTSVEAYASAISSVASQIGANK
jgi:glycosyltransferase involved in cell wall biosynthesis